MSEREWTLIDTETTGLVAPIYVVELAAQRMRGWQPIGSSFRVLLNHNVDIPSGAQKVHGYTRAFLAKNGIEPLRAHRTFSAYAGTTPLVAYNLQYDYDKVLLPEWQRLQLPPTSTRGFCALRLTQKLINPSRTENFKLQTLREFYRLPERVAHSALGDVQTVIDLLGSVLRPIAERKGLNSYGDLENYANGNWYPETLCFGKHKGRNFREAQDDPDLKGWLKWLSQRSEADSAKMGKWYLDQLHQFDEKARHSSPASVNPKEHLGTSTKRAQASAPPKRGDDVTTTASVALETAASGGSVRVFLPMGRALDVAIPAGIEEGTQIRLRGQGQRAPLGGEPGDALITVKFARHPIFQVSGRDLKSELPVTLDQATFGSTVVTLTLEGRVELSIPAGSSDGRVLRLRGKGLPAFAGKAVGDLYLTLKIAASEYQPMRDRAPYNNYRWFR